MSDESRFASQEKFIELKSTVPIKNSLNFDWGSFHISRKAESECRMTPLAASLNEPAVRTSSIHKYDPFIDIWLVGKSELDERDVESYSNSLFADNTTNNEFGLIVNLHYFDLDDRLTVVLSFDKDWQELKAHLLNQFQELHELSEEDLNEPFDIEGAPEGTSPKEVIENNIPQMYNYSLRRIIEEILPEISVEWMRNQANTQFINDYKRIGRAAIIGAGAMLAADYISDNDLDPAFSLPVLAIYGLSYGYSTFHNVKTYLEANNKRENQLQAAAYIFANTIARDIYKAHSTEHFDKMAEDWLKKGLSDSG